MICVKLDVSIAGSISAERSVATSFKLHSFPKSLIGLKVMPGTAS